MSQLAQNPLPAWALSQRLCRQEVARWIAACLKVHPHLPYRGGHDEGSFASSWDGHCLLTGDEAAQGFLRSFTSQVYQWFAQHLEHGYWPTQEVHHGPEMFCYFLARMRGLFPQDPQLRELFCHAAHHTGNWVTGIPAWYDWEAHRFRSWKLGTAEVIADPPYDVNVPDHLKLLHVALPAYLLSGDERYLELSRDYAGAWAERLLQAEGELPVVDFPAAADPGTYNKRALGLMRGHAKRHRLLAGQLEPFVAAGAMDVFLDLFRLTSEERFAAAARRLAEPLIGFLSDPESDPPGTQLLHYRRVTGDHALDEQMLAALPDTVPGDLDQLVLQVGVDNDPLLTGIGKRRDMLKWGYRTDSGVMPETAPSPTALLLKYELTGDHTAAAAAFAMAAARLRLARSALASGRQHGCGGVSVSAVMRGHGRNGDVGLATGMLYPALFGGSRYCGGLGPRYRYEYNGRHGVPDTVSLLCRDQGVTLCNLASDGASIKVSPVDSEATPVVVELAAHARQTLCLNE